MKYDDPFAELLGNYGSGSPAPKPALTRQEAKTAFQKAFKDRDVEQAKEILIQNPTLFQAKFRHDRDSFSLLEYIALNLGERPEMFKLMTWLSSRSEVTDEAMSQGLFRMFLPEVARAGMRGGMEYSAMLARKSYPNKVLSSIKKISNLPLSLRDSKGRTLLMIAAMQGWIKVCQYLGQQPGLSLQDKDNEDKSLCLYASGSKQLLAWLIKENAFSFTDRDAEGNNVFLSSISRGWVTTAPKDLKRLQWIATLEGFSPTVRNSKGQTALMIAARTGLPPKVLQWLMGLPGISLHDKDNDGLTAFMHAFESIKKEGPRRNPVILLANTLAQNGASQADKAYAKKCLEGYADDSKKAFVQGEMRKILDAKLYPLDQEVTNLLASKNDVAGDGSIPSLVASLSSQDASIKKGSLLALSELANAKVQKHQKMHLKQMSEAGAIDPLVVILSDSLVGLQKETFPLLIKLANNKVNIRQIVESGCIELLVNFLSDLDAGIRFSAVQLLKKLIAPTENKKRLDKASGVEALVAVLQDENIGVKRYAASTLMLLAYNSNMRKRIGQCGGVEALVSLIPDSDKTLKQSVIGALATLVEDGTNQGRIVEGNGTEPLVMLLSSRDSYVLDNALKILLWLPSNAEVTEKMSKAGAIKSVTALLSSDVSNSVTQQAVRILNRLAIRSHRDRSGIVAADGITPLIAFLNYWDEDIRSYATKLLITLTQGSEDNVIPHGNRRSLLSSLRKRMLENPPTESDDKKSLEQLIEQLEREAATHATPEELKAAYEKAIASRSKEKALSIFKQLVGLLSEEEKGICKRVLAVLTDIQKSLHGRDFGLELRDIYPALAILLAREAKNKDDTSLLFEVLTLLATLVEEYEDSGILGAGMEDHLLFDKGECLASLLNHKELRLALLTADIMFKSDAGNYYHEGKDNLLPALFTLLARCVKERRGEDKVLPALSHIFVTGISDNGEGGAVYSASDSIDEAFKFFTQTEDAEVPDEVELTIKTLLCLSADPLNVKYMQEKYRSQKNDLHDVLQEESKMSAEHRKRCERFITVLEGVDADLDIEKHPRLSTLLAQPVHMIHGWKQDLASTEKKKAGHYVTFSDRFNDKSYAHMDKEIDYTSTFVVHSSCSGSLALNAMRSFSETWLVVDDFSAFKSEDLLQALSRLRCIDALYLSLSQPLIGFLKPLFPIFPRGLHIVLDNDDMAIVQECISILPPGFTVSVRKHPTLDSEDLEEVVASLPPQSVYTDFEAPITKASSQKGILATLPFKVRLLCHEKDYSLSDEERNKVVALDAFQVEQRGRLTKQKKRPIISNHTPQAKYSTLIGKGTKPFLYNDIPVASMDSLAKVLGSRPLLVSSIVSTACIKHLLVRKIKVKFGSQMGISEKYLCPLPYHLTKPSSSGPLEAPYLPPKVVSFKRLDDTIAELVGRAKKPKKRFRKKVNTCGVQMHLIKPFKGYDVSKPTLFVLAGRKERAMLPPLSKKYHVIVVLTPTEFEGLFKDDQEEQATLSYLQALVIDSIQRPYKSQPDDVSTITSRRLAVLLMAEKLGLEHFVMLDDNIDQVNLELDGSFIDVYQSLLDYSKLYKQSFVSVASYSKRHKRYDNTSLGSKCHLWNVTQLKQHSTLFSSQRNAWLTLMPENEHYWGQVLYAQLVLRELAATNLATSIYPCKQMVLIRSKQHQNSTQLRGVRAQPLPFTAEYQSFLKGIDPIFYQTIERVICIFNHQVNEQIALNQSRIDRLLTLDLEKHQAAANKVPMQALALPNVDRTIQHNVKDCLVSLISKRQAIEAEADGFKPYDHQWRALEYAVKAIDETGQLDMVLYEMATGAGKTFIQTVLCLAMLASTEGTVVYLSPRIELAEQSYQSMIGFIDRFPALSESFSISKSKILKMFSGSDAALTKNAILANECLHPRYLMIACKDSFYKLLEEEGFRQHLHFIVFDESHLTFKPKQLSEFSDMLEQTSIVTFSATPFYTTLANRFTFDRKEAIQKRLLVPLHIDKVQPRLLRSDSGPRLDQVKKLVTMHRLPGGKLLMQSKGIIFVKSQVEAKSLVEYLNRELPAVSCYQISSNNTEHQKELKLYREQSVAIAVAVDMLIVGFDNSKVTWCVNLKTKIRWHKRIQAHGRFLRRDRDNPDKIGTIIMFKSIKGKSIFPEGFTLPESYVKAKNTLDPEGSERLAIREASAERPRQKKSKATDSTRESQNVKKARKAPIKKGVPVGGSVLAGLCKRKKPQASYASKRTKRFSVFEGCSSSSSCSNAVCSGSSKHKKSHVTESKKRPKLSSIFPAELESKSGSHAEQGSKSSL